MNVDRDIRFEVIARLCPNTTGAELRSVCTEAGMFAIRARKKSISEKDFMESVNKVGREGGREGGRERGRMRGREERRKKGMTSTHLYFCCEGRTYRRREGGREGGRARRLLIHFFVFGT